LKIIVAGSSKIRNQFQIFDVLNNHQKKDMNITHVISTGERGVDHFAVMWANQNKIPVTTFHIDSALGLRKAISVRNQRMIDHIKLCDGAFIIIKDGKSKGSKNIIDTAWGSDIKIFETKIKE